MLLFFSGLHLSCMLADTAKTRMLGIWKIWKKEMVILKERLRLWGNLQTRTNTHRNSVSATWYVQLTPTFLVCYESYLQLQCGKLHGEIFLLARIDRAVSGMVYDAGSQVPVCASIWSCPSEVVLGFSAASILTFCRNHHLLQVLFFVLCHVSGSKTLLGKFYLFFLHC